MCWNLHIVRHQNDITQQAGCPHAAQTFFNSYQDIFKPAFKQNYRQTLYSIHQPFTKGACQSLKDNPKIVCTMAHNDIFKTRDVDPVLESGSRPRLFAEPESGPEARYGITTSTYQ
jgi:hypothetical protein